MHCLPPADKHVLINTSHTGLIPASLLLIFFIFSQSVQAATLKPFTTDGCSLFPEGTPAQQSLWLNCCVAHDRAYWLGGSYEARQTADDALAACVAEVGEPEIALLMLKGVRAGGSPFWPTAFRWGYGWPYLEGWKPRGYKMPDANEKKQIEQMSTTSDE